MKKKFQTKEEFKTEFERRIIEKYGRSIEQAHKTEKYMVLGEMIRDYVGVNWKETKETVDVLFLYGIFDRTIANEQSDELGNL